MTKIRQWCSGVLLAWAQWIIDFVRAWRVREERFVNTVPAVPPLAEFEPPPRVYDRREVVLPSGRFAAMSPITWMDVLSATNPNDPSSLWFVTRLAISCVAIDGVPVTAVQVLHLEASEFSPIASMLNQEAVSVSAFSKGVA